MVGQKTPEQELSNRPTGARNRNASYGRAIVEVGGIVLGWSLVFFIRSGLFFRLPSMAPWLLGGSICKTRGCDISEE